MTVAEAQALAVKLDLDVDDTGICLACLSIVSFAIYGGNPRKIAGAVASITPDLWEEGLALPAQLALERARRRGLPQAGAALDEARKLGARSRIARAIVRRLGADLAARARGDLTQMGFERWPPPELN